MDNIVVNSERWFSLEDYPGEKWMNVRNTNYSISTKGRLRRDPHSTDMYVGGVYVRTLTYKAKILRLTQSVQGYWHTRISVNGSIVDVRIHRLVAEAFIQNPNSFPHINHKNEDPSDNRVENLEWCTAVYNANYGTARERMYNSVKKNNIGKWHTINQYSKDGMLSNSFACKSDLEEKGYKYNSIAKCCKHMIPTSYGFVWRYDDDPFSLEYKKHKVHTIDSMGRFSPCRVYQYDNEGNLMNEYESMSAAAKAVSGNTTMIGYCCKGMIPRAYGYIWRKEKSKITEKYKNKNEHPVLQYSKDMVLINRFESVKEAATIVAKDPKKFSSISECCSGKSKTYLGYIWRYDKKE